MRHDASKIIGPYFFFLNLDTAAVKESYNATFQQFFGYVQETDVWFQQDGATWQTAKMSMDWLRSRFQNRIISIKPNVFRPPKLPELSPLDFLLSGKAID